jgi:RNA polymerase sigma factor (sigma-70 family)
MTEQGKEPERSPKEEIDMDALWRRYHLRLLTMAQQQLRMSPQRMADEHDVVVSVFKSFYRAAQEQRIAKDADENALWRLLVTLTARKSIKLLRHAGRDKRDSRLLESDVNIDALVSEEPTPEFAAAFVDQYQELGAQLPDDDMRLLLQRKLEGFSNLEIAQQLDCSMRTVKRRLTLLRELLLVALDKQSAE